MTVTAIGPGSKLAEEFKALTTKQWAGIIAGIIVALLVEMFLGTTCMGFFIAAVALYMIPHILGVSSVKIKAIIGVLFAVMAIVAGTFAYSGTIESYEGRMHTSDTSTVQDIVYDADAGTITFTLITDRAPGDSENPRTWHGIAETVPVEGISFGIPNRSGGASHVFRETTDSAYKEGTTGILTVTDAGMKGDKYVYTCTASDFNLENGKLYLVGAGITDNNAVSTKESVTFMIDRESNQTAIYFTGTAYTVAFAVVIFFMILIFSALMRSSAEKSRKKMEAQGRLYPKGYGRCKNCGATVLPGEVNCRKCGTYIDVPEELKPHKKDFFQCTECGAEVPADADVCPKCGAKFEGSETEVVREDGEVETSEDDMIACPGCDYHVPAGTDWCPKCGRMLKKE